MKEYRAWMFLEDSPNTARGHDFECKEDTQEWISLLGKEVCYDGVRTSKVIKVIVQEREVTPWVDISNEDWRP